MEQYVCIANNSREFIEDTACVKSTSYNLVKAGYKVHVISDCVTSYDLKKLDEMFAYYGSKGCDVKKLGDYTDGGNTI